MKKHYNAIYYSKNSGFTLIEVMVVVVILGILAALIVPNIINRPQQARITKAKTDILSIQNALDLYKLDNGAYPTTEQGLQALVTRPTTDPIPPSWNASGYLQSLPMDPWGVPYQYANDNDKVTIFSYGPSGKSGGDANIISNTNAKNSQGTGT